MLGKTLLLPLLLTVAVVAQPATYDPTPRIGILIPKGPPDYALWYDALKGPHDPPLTRLQIRPTLLTNPHPKSPS